jgi:disulfide reductase
VKRMKQLGVLVLFCVGFLAACQQKPVAVSNEPAIDFAAVLQEAKSKNKNVLLDFTGSDWCPPCIAMHENVFSKSEFKAYANTNLIFVEVDFPNDKPQSVEQKKANEELSNKFKVEAFPTFVLLNPEGKELWRKVGAFVKAPAEFISAIEAVKPNSAPTTTK